MKRLLCILFAVFLLALSSCKDQEKVEAEVIKTHESSPSEKAAEIFENGEIFTSHEYYELSDGSFKCGDYSYKYKLEIAGRMNNAAKDSTYIILSNTKDITFDMAWKAAGYSSNMNDYFKPEQAIIVGIG